MGPAFHIKPDCRAQRLFGKRVCVHRICRMRERDGINRLRNQCQQHDSFEIPKRIVRIHAADSDTICVKRKRDSPDHPHDRILWKQHFSRMVDQHCDHCDDFQKRRILIRADLCRGKRPRNHQSLFRASQAHFPLQTSIDLRRKSPQRSFVSLFLNRVDREQQ